MARPGPVPPVCWHVAFAAGRHHQRHCNERQCADQFLHQAGYPLMTRKFDPRPDHPAVPTLIRLHSMLGGKMLENKKQQQEGFSSRTCVDNPKRVRAQKATINDMLGKAMFQSAGSCSYARPAAPMLRHRQSRQPESATHIRGNDKSPATVKEQATRRDIRRPVPVVGAASGDFARERCRPTATGRHSI